MKKIILATLVATSALTHAAVTNVGRNYTANAVAEANAQQRVANSDVTTNFARVEQARSEFNDKGTVSPWVNEVETNLVEAKVIGADYLNTAQANSVYLTATTADVENINGNAGSLSSLTMHGGKITNLKAGEADTDAVNVSQLRDGVQNAKTYTDNAIKNVNAGSISYTNNAIKASNDEMKKRNNKLKKGIAGAIAHANIPQAVKAGGSTLGVGGGYYADKTAVALGYSRLSDNTKHTIKVSVGYDGAYTNAGAGYGYNW